MYTSECYCMTQQTLIMSFNLHKYYELDTIIIPFYKGESAIL